MSSTSGYVHGNVDYNFYGTGALHPTLSCLWYKPVRHSLAEFLRRVGWNKFLWALDL